MITMFCKVCDTEFDADLVAVCVNCSSRYLGTRESAIADDQEADPLELLRGTCESSCAEIWRNAQRASLRLQRDGETPIEARTRAYEVAFRTFFERVINAAGIDGEEALRRIRDEPDTSTATATPGGADHTGETTDGKS